MRCNTLKALRELNNYTQDFLAKKVLGISQTAYCRLEAKPLKLKADQAEKLSGLYKIPASDILSAAAPVLTFQHSLCLNTSKNDFNTGSPDMAEVAILETELENLKIEQAVLLRIIARYYTLK